MKFEKNIFTYWHQGFDNAPAVVRLCVHSLCRHHTSWNIHLLDSETVHQWLDPIPIPSHHWQHLPLAHQSDIIRTQLLKNHGGVWADPTIYFTGSLDSWLESAMKSGVFFFDRPGRDRLISNWFIASEKNNYIIDEIYKSLCSYWNDNNFRSIGFTDRPFVNFVSRFINRNVNLPRIWFSPTFIFLLKHAPYMVYHYNFAKLKNIDKEFMKIWEEVPKISADGPHSLLRYGLNSSPSKIYYNILESSTPPLFKLTWKHGKELSSDSVLNDLFKREGVSLIN